MEVRDPRSGFVPPFGPPFGSENAIDRFLTHLKTARVPVVESNFSAKRIVKVQSQLEKLISQNYYLNKS
jgi:ATP-dependent RNA helicase DDX18/HAS1